MEIQCEECLKCGTDLIKYREQATENERLQEQVDEMRERMKQIEKECRQWHNARPLESLSYILGLTEKYK